MILEQQALWNYQEQTSGVSDSPARTLASQGNKKACKKASEADYFTKLCDCLPVLGKKIDPDGFSLKMLRIYLALEEDLTSRGCCLKWGGYGYSTIEWQLINSKDYGVPQNRERVFIVGHLGNGSGRKVFPISPTGGENSCELQELTSGQPQALRCYSPDGLSRCLNSGAGGLGAKTGLYLVE